jgi:hypothetical protein
MKSSEQLDKIIDYLRKEFIQIPINESDCNIIPNIGKTIRIRPILPIEATNIKIIYEIKK